MERGSQAARVRRRQREGGGATNAAGNCVDEPDRDGGEEGLDDEDECDGGAEEEIDGSDEEGVAGHAGGEEAVGFVGFGVEDGLGEDVVIGGVWGRGRG